MTLRDALSGDLRPWRIVSAGYFDTMGIRIEEGRAFTAQEAAQGAPVVVIDASLANRFWPDGDAIGSHIRYDGPEDVRIIGVAANVHTAAKIRG